MSDSWNCFLIIFRIQKAETPTDYWQKNELINQQQIFVNQVGWSESSGLIFCSYCLQDNESFVWVGISLGRLKLLRLWRLNWWDDLAEWNCWKAFRKKYFVSVGLFLCCSIGIDRCQFVNSVLNHNLLNVIIWKVLTYCHNESMIFLFVCSKICR